jgi:hypothetical protein
VVSYCLQQWCVFVLLQVFHQRALLPRCSRARASVVSQTGAIRPVTSGRL